MRAPRGPIWSDGASQGIVVNGLDSGLINGEGWE
jgi:hypothetical protein